MDANELAHFGTMKTAHGDVEAAFCFFFFQDLLSLYNKDFLQCFIYASLFLECQCIAGQTGFHYLIFLLI